MRSRITTGICAFLWLAGGTLGCSDLGEPAPPLYATTDGQHLYLTNTTDDVLYYFVAPTDWLPFLDWVPNSNPDATNRVLPGTTVTLHLEDFFWVKEGYRSSDLTVFWWDLIRQPDGVYMPGEIRSLRVRV